MSWADAAKARLARGDVVTIRPRGDSMRPRIRSGDSVTLMPVAPDDLEVGDVVLATVRGRDYLHEVSAVSPKRVQISNKRGHVNGWVARTRVHGRMTHIVGRFR